MSTSTILGALLLTYAVGTLGGIAGLIGLFGFALAMGVFYAD